MYYVEELIRHILNKIKVNLNVVINSSSKIYDKSYQINLTNQKIIELDLMSLIDNPSEEVDKIFDNLKKVFIKVIKEAVCNSSIERAIS